MKGEIRNSPVRYSKPDAEKLEGLRLSINRLTVVPESEWTVFREYIRSARLEKGEALTTIGESEINGAFVVRGLLKAFFLTQSGDEYVRNFAAEGDFIAAYGSAIRNEPSNVTIEAMEPCDLLVIRYKDLLNSFPRHVCWQEFGRKVVEHYYSAREQHRHQLLTMTGRERYEAFLRNSPKLIGRVPQKYVAQYLGMNPAAFNRLVAARQRRKGR